MKKQVCVIGLGRFGGTVAKEFYQSGHDVLAIDLDESKIQDMLGHVTVAVRADASSESVLQELDVADFDVAVVALGSSGRMFSPALLNDDTERKIECHSALARPSSGRLCTRQKMARVPRA